MYTPGPAISFCTSFAAAPQNAQSPTSIRFASPVSL
jgi:hypothetical protein